MKDTVLQHIKDWEIATTPYLVSGRSFVQDMWMADDWLEVRDEIHQAGLDNHPKVVELDKNLIRLVIKKGAEKPETQKPLKYWWWHLDKIAKKEYPAELLPEHLKEIYLTLKHQW